MSKVIRGVLAIASTLFLSGCPMGWTRPNTSQAQFEQDNYECRMLAEQTYPRPVPNSGQREPINTNCRFSGNSADCTSTGGERSTPADSSALSRAMSVGRCMRGKGYTGG